MLKSETDHNGSNVHRREAKSLVEQVTRIFHDYHDEIYRIIRFHIDNEHDVDDIFQELFLSFLKNPVFLNTHNVLAYIYKTITNDIIDSIRKKKNYQSKIARYAKQKNDTAGVSNPERTAILYEDFKKFYTLMQKRLPPRQAQALHLRYIKEYSTSEAAEKMGVDKTTLSRYLSVGLKKMQKLSKAEVEPNIC